MSAPLLNREEYIEQAHFFRIYRERLQQNMPAQEILTSIHEEILTTTKLPMALEFLTGEILLTGRVSDGMTLLSHYFTTFQTFIMGQAEEDKSKFDQAIALEVLQREAEYRSNSPTAAGLFIYQFECVARNHLGYDQGLESIAADPLYDEHWSDWILKIRRQLGTIDFADMIYHRSEHSVEEKRRSNRDDDYQPSYSILFGNQEGRIARANRGKEPLLLFAALQRQLGYPAVPRTKPKSEDGPAIHPALEQRLQRIEQTLKLIQAELKGGIDLSQFYADPTDSKDE